MQIAGETLPCKYYGKPMPDQYRMVEAVLVRQAEEMGLDLPDRSENGPEALPFSAIYMVGDNPASDIRGARNAGATYSSLMHHARHCQPKPFCHLCCRLDPAIFESCMHGQAVLWAVALHSNKFHIGIWLIQARTK